MKKENQGNESPTTAPEFSPPQAERVTGSPEWWRGLSAGEKAVIRGLIGAMRGLKCSRERQVAQAAYKWERGITCFIKLRLMHNRHTRRPGVKEVV